MSQAKDDIKVQVTQRVDGRVTVTIKLIGWRAQAINGILYHMRGSKASIIARIGNTVRDKLIAAFQNWEALEQRQTPSQ